MLGTRVDDDDEANVDVPVAVGDVGGGGRVLVVDDCCDTDADGAGAPFQVTSRACNG